MWRHVSRICTNSKTLTLAQIENYLKNIVRYYFPNYDNYFRIFSFSSTYFLSSLVYIFSFYNCIDFLNVQSNTHIFLSCNIRLKKFVKKNLTTTTLNSKLKVQLIHSSDSAAKPHGIDVEHGKNRKKLLMSFCRSIDGRT